MMQRLLLTTIALALVAPLSMAAVLPEDPDLPSVIAVIGEAGLNPAHAEFRHTRGPLPMLPPHEVITLPRLDGRDFSAIADEMESGKLGRLEPGHLYRIDGTRLLVYVPAALTAPYDLIEGPTNSSGTNHRRHGTGATGSAIGATTGTAPDAWAVFIPTSDPSGYEWVASQDWIDVATVSSYTLRTVDSGVLPCPEAPHVRTFTEDRTFFASSGNSEQSSYYLLNAMPEFYLVGGVDEEGNAVMKPRVPASADQEELAWSAPVATRTFESGDRYEFITADHDSIDGLERFGGTSGAAPTTAGRAAKMISEARTLIHDDGTRSAKLLAAVGANAVLPARGPLADGDLTAAELNDLLHAVAEPKLPGPARYAVEGYGALTDATTSLAIAVLRGDKPLPARPDDDRAHATSEEVRGAAFDARGCG